MSRSLLVAPLAVAAAAVLAGIAAPAARADGGPVLRPHIEVELVAEGKTVRPGGHSDLGLRLKMDPGWHVYWKNAGDSGTAPGIEWRLPAGARAGPIQWPAPVRLRAGPLSAFAYEGEIVLPVRVAWPDALPAGEVLVEAAVDWLVCQEECTPGDATLSLRLPVAVGEPQPDPRWAPLFSAARALLPRRLSPGAASMSAAGNALLLKVSKGGPWDAPAAAVEFFPEDDVLANAAPQAVSRDASGTTLRLAKSARPQPTPSALRGVLVVGTGPARTAFLVDTASVGPRDGPLEDETSLWEAVALALLGGVLLNLMPCVLPVLSIKVLGFVERAGEDPARAKLHGWSYGAGVLAAFWALAGIVLALRAGGERVGWGFQLQEPLVVAGGVLLFHLMGLNLFGLFEFGSGLAALAHRGRRSAPTAGSDGYAGSFWGGVLATVVATPCTGPFMGVAVSRAMTGGAADTIAILSALGAGMAAPYVLLAAFPRALRRVPKPGPWMETLKRALAFPLFVVAVWLAGVFARQTGTEGLIALLWAVLGATLAAWVFGRWGSPARHAAVRWLAGRALPLALLLLSGAYVARAAAQAEEGVPAGASQEGRLSPRGAGRDADGWEPYAKERLSEALAEGRPVFVDFTADWCLTCKANEATALSSDAFREAVKRHDVVLLKADWTRKDPRITEALRALRRDSVPVYVVHSPLPGRAPAILPQVLTPGLVADALQAATAGAPAGK